MLYTKCTYCDKLHLCTYQDRADLLLSQNEINNTITQSIIPLIPEDTRLRELFLKWSSLKKDERAAVDEKIDQSDLNLYLPLKQALSHWEILQDTEGAPGVDSGVYSFSCDAHLEEELLRTIYKVHSVVASVMTGISSCTETQSEPNMLDVSSDELSPSESKESLGVSIKLKQKSASTGNLLIY